MKVRKIIAGAIVAGVVTLGVPTAAFANHDCGPPDKHDDHTRGPEDRKNPCK